MTIIKKHNYISLILFKLNGLILFTFGCWILLDPRQNYTLNLVDFSEDEPLYEFAIFVILVTSFFIVFVGFVGCIGVLKLECFLLSSFISFVILIITAKWISALMVLTYKDKFVYNKLDVFLANVSQNRYYRDKWVLPMIDSVQFYQKCCGGTSPTDYLNSFWYKTNTNYGTRSFVPLSCCKQSQNGRAWALNAIDPLCTTYPYFTKAFNDSVNIKGCGKPTKELLDNQILIFLLFVVGTSIIDFFSAFIGIIYVNKKFKYMFF